MVNKKGFIKIVEATLAILIVIGAVLLLSANKRQPESRGDLSGELWEMLDEVAREKNLRTQIVFDYDTNLPYTEQPNIQIISNIENYLRPKIINPSFNFTIRICSLKQSCILEHYPVENPKNIFAVERIVTTTVNNTELNPKKIKIFLWTKE